ncbi:unknown protein [Seminavis robusta]|uniref:Uncharacterized protein n=1 Tax=Seminavis robusta TaxID=568900 RepID=A0A9N8DRY4_9STRA|nr:unknown protein [Seminavis robusta]|eukprot:Sro239_g095810.1 n/a (173) ;mRNA; f:23952-24470
MSSKVLISSWLTADTAEQVKAALQKIGVEVTMTGNVMTLSFPDGSVNQVAASLEDLKVDSPPHNQSDSDSTASHLSHLNDQDVLAPLPSEFIPSDFDSDSTFDDRKPAPKEVPRRRRTRFTRKQVTKKEDSSDEDNFIESQEWVCVQYSCPSSMSLLLLVFSPDSSISLPLF